MRIFRALAGLIVSAAALYPPAALPADSACSLLPQAEEIASRLTGLKLKQPVSCSPLDKERFRALASRLITYDLDMDHLREYGRALFYLGLIPVDYAFDRCIVDALAVNAASYYSHRLKLFVVPDWIGSPMVLLVHEATHALQDQNYGIGRFAPNKLLFDDQNVAQAALLEGQAVLAEEEFLKSAQPGEPRDPDPAGQLPLLDERCALPQTLTLMFDAQYQDGEIFFYGLKKEKRGKDLERVFRHPFSTTRALLDKKVTDAPRPGFELIQSQAQPISGELGQIGLRSVLTQQLSFSEAMRAARHLLGDHFAYSKKAAFSAELVFDTQENAAMIFQALEAIWNTRLAREKSEPNLAVFKDTACLFTMRHSRQRIFLACNPERDKSLAGR